MASAWSSIALAVPACRLCRRAPLGRDRMDNQPALQGGEPPPPATATQPLERYLMAIIANLISRPYEDPSAHEKELVILFVIGGVQIRAADDAEEVRSKSTLPYQSALQGGEPHGDLHTSHCHIH